MDPVSGVVWFGQGSALCVILEESCPFVGCASVAVNECIKVLGPVRMVNLLMKISQGDSHVISRISRSREQKKWCPHLSGSFSDKKIPSRGGHTGLKI